MEFIVKLYHLKIYIVNIDGLSSIYKMVKFTTRKTFNYIIDIYFNF
jgi:hypothetical protein